MTTIPPRKGPFFDFLNRRVGIDFDEFIRTHTKYRHYMEFHQVVLPCDYGDAELEYLAIRNRCAMFDASSSRKYHIRGDRAGDFLDYLLTRPIGLSSPMRASYAVFCNSDGTLKDDAIVYKYADDDYLLMPALTHDEYFEELRGRFGSALSVTECSDSLAGISLQGPLSTTVLHSWGLDGIDGLKPFEVREYPLGEGRMRISRMGFTADLGYECWFDPALCTAFQERITAAARSLGMEIPGYGLTAVEACRLEGGLVVPGRECAIELAPQPGFERSPFELGLGWLVKFDGREFVGHRALRAESERGSRFALLSFAIDSPRTLGRQSKLYATIDGEDSVIGLLTSSSWSWGLRKTVGLASVERRYADCPRGHVYLSEGDERMVVDLKRGPLINLSRRTQLPAPVGLT
jgi:aminomethyltransferase